VATIGNLNRIDFISFMNDRESIIWQR